VLDNLWYDLKKTIADLTHLPVSTAPEQLITRLCMLTGRNYQPILELIPQAKKIPKQQFITIALKFDAYRKELNEWRKSSQFVTK
jgi:hypothetical protein